MSGFSSNMSRRRSEVKQTKEKKVYTTAHPKIGRIRFATRRPMKEARAVPMKRREYTLDPSL